MPSDHIEYRSDYKYQLANEYQLVTRVIPPKDVKTSFIDLDISGALTIKSKYAWDGASGPVTDSSRNMRASLVHDALYQLMRDGDLIKDTHRKPADKLFRELCKEDGVSRFKAYLWYRALRMWGDPSASPQAKKMVHIAPEH